MKKLPLYPGDLRAPVEREAASSYTSACRRCPLGGQKATCLPPAGTGGGGTLIVVDQITDKEATQGAQGISPLNQRLASHVNKFTRRPFLLDAAIKCHAGAKPDDEHIEACRTYLTHTLQEAKPDRVIVAGPSAAKALLGRSPHLQSVRRGYGWLTDCSWAAPVQLVDGRTVRPIPVFFVMPMWLGQTNHFYANWIAEDVKWACTTPIPKLPPWDGFTEVVESCEEALRAVEQLRASEWITFDVETSGPMHSGKLNVVSLAFSTKEGRSWVWDRDALTDPGCFEAAAELLEDEGVRKIAQVAKFDMQAISQGMGISVRGLWGDTRVWRRQVESDSMSDLSTMAELIGMGGDSTVVDNLVDGLVKKASKEAQQVKRQICKEVPAIGADLEGTTNQVETLLVKWNDALTDQQRAVLLKGYNPRAYVYGEVPPDVLSRYNAGDVVITAGVAAHLRPRMAQEGLVHAWESLWGPATEALVQVETWGFRVDVPQIKRLSAHWGQQQRALRSRFSQYDVDPNSNPSVAELLYKKLKLKASKFSEKTGAASTDKGSLEALRGRHPVVDDLIEWRHISKLKSQYADGMMLHIAPDGAIHTTYNIDGARSGRMSSENPNMQNIPSEERGADGKLVKDCFIARPGHMLLAADYAQLEFRVAADLADDPAMRAVFESGIDFHQATAEFIAPIVWKIPASQVTKIHRSGAKAFNFGIMYGMQDGGIAMRAKCSIEEAQAIRAAVLGKFRKFAQWIEARRQETRKTGTAWTYWLGKKAHCRQLHLVGDQHDQGKRINAENSSFNTPVQGTASFYCLASVTVMVNWLLKTRLPARLVATVHDSIVLEVREDQLLRVARKLSGTMRGWPTMTGVPLDVDLKSGPTWGSMSTYMLPEAQAAGILGGPAAAAAVMADQLSQLSD